MDEQPGVAPDLSVVIVSYNTSELTLRCLESVVNQVACRAEVIVVDNASVDGSVDAVTTSFPSVKVVALTSNVGFARGVNIGAGTARGEFLLLLNPDAVVHPGAIDHVLQRARSSPGYGIWGGQIRRPDGSIDPRSCWGLPSLWSVTCFGLGLSTAFRHNRLFDPESLGSWKRDTVRAVGYVTGCFMLIRRSLWEELGAFDPRFFMYSEDVDLAVRAARAGSSCAIDPEARLSHDFGSASTSVNSGVLMLAGRTTYIRKHWSPRAARFGLAMMWLGAAHRAGLSALLRPFGRRQSRPAWPGVWRQRQRWLSGYPDAEPVASILRTG